MTWALGLSLHLFISTGKPFCLIVFLGCQVRNAFDESPHSRVRYVCLSLWLLLLQTLQNPSIAERDLALLYWEPKQHHLFSIFKNNMSSFTGCDLCTAGWTCMDLWCDVIQWCYSFILKSWFACYISWCFCLFRSNENVHNIMHTLFWNRASWCNAEFGLCTRFLCFL